MRMHNSEKSFSLFVEQCFLQVAGYEEPILYLNSFPHAFDIITFGLCVTQVSRTKPGPLFFNWSIFHIFRFLLSWPTYFYFRAVCYLVFYRKHLMQIWYQYRLHLLLNVDHTGKRCYMKLLAVMFQTSSPTSVLVLSQWLFLTVNPYSFWTYLKKVWSSTTFLHSNVIATILALS